MLILFLVACEPCPAAAVEGQTWGEECSVGFWMASADQERTQWAPVQAWAEFHVAWAEPDPASNVVVEGATESAVPTSWVESNSAASSFDVTAITRSGLALRAGGPGDGRVSIELLYVHDSFTLEVVHVDDVRLESRPVDWGSGGRLDCTSEQHGTVISVHDQTACWLYFVPQDADGRDVLGQWPSAVWADGRFATVEGPQSDLSFGVLIDQAGVLAVRIGDVERSFDVQAF